jgi:hypothetical protein
VGKRTPEATHRLRWIRRQRAAGLWVHPLPASMFGSGTSDLLVGEPARSFEPPMLLDPQPACLRFVESKRTLYAPGGKLTRAIYRPSQVTEAQALFLDNVTKHGGHGTILLLDEDGFLELEWQWAREHTVNRAEFKNRMEAW